MADSIYLFTGSNTTTAELELALDTDNIQLVVPGTEIGIAQHEDVWSENIWENGARLLRHRVKNGEWPLKFLVGDRDGSTPADDLSDAVIAFGRLMRQARRYDLDGGADSVNLYVKLDGATNPTYYRVKTATPSGASLLDEAARLRGDAELSFTLITEPFGYGDEVTLENFLENPHFVEDIDADGVPDGWSATGATLDIDTTRFLTGDQSVQVTATSGQNIVSDTVDCSDYQGESFVGYAWVHVQSGSDSMVVHAVGDVSGTIDDTSYATTAESAVDDNGGTWYRIEVSGTIGATDTTILLRVSLVGAASVFNIDKCYLQLGTSSIPSGWSSGKFLVNRHDSEAEGNIHYLDVDDIPGDTEADLRIQFQDRTVTNAVYGLFIAQRTRETQAVSIVLDDADGSAGDDVGVSAAATANAAYSGGQYTTCTLSSDSTWRELIRWDMEPSDIKRWGGKYLVVSCGPGIAGGNHNADMKLRARVSIPASGTVTASVTDAQSGNGEGIMVLGVVEILPDFPNDYGKPNPLDFEIQGYTTSQPQDYVIDCVMLLPLDGLRVFEWGSYTYDSTTEPFVDDGIRKWSYIPIAASGGALKADVSTLGKFISLDPGSPQRLYFLVKETDDYYDAQREFAVTLTYRPRTEFLFGSD